MTSGQQRDPYSEPVPVVIDIGSTTIKIGFAGEDYPRLPDLPAAVGHFKHEPEFPSDVERHHYEIYERGYAVGYEITMERAFLNIQHLCERGVVKDWDVMDKVVRYFFIAGLRVDPASRPVLITCSPAAQQGDIDAMARFMRDKVRASEIYMAPQPELALRASGMETGVVVDLGDTTGWVVPVVDGDMVRPAIQLFPLGGRDVTQYIAQHAFTRLPEGERPWPPEGLILAEDIKEQMCYVAADPAAGAESAAEQGYAMPDGRELPVGSLRFMGPELLFDPAIAGKQAPPIDALVRAAIAGCPGDVRPALWRSIVLAGGTSLFPGLGTRLEKVLQGRATTPVKVLSPEPRGQSRQYSSWIGGSMLFSSPALQRYRVGIPGG
ncbi:MAG: actin family protein [Candidatus Lokiarchaeota archaeon]|nr:actin family protein [Candidatus Lokiarchaeota archaeon]